jgi:hypothetical protein
MAIRRPNHPLEWNEVGDDDGSLIGWYGIRAGTITVRRPDGGEKTTHVGPPGGAKGLARIMLGEKSDWR